MSDDDLQVETADAGASDTFPMQAGAIKKGTFVIMKGHPCKVVEYSTSKTGKHGHAKANMTGIDIFTGRKYEEICPTSHNMSCPNLTRDEFQLIDISEDGFCSLMDPATGAIKDDLKVPDEGDGVLCREHFASGSDTFVTVLSAMGMQMIVSSKQVGSGGN